MKKYISLLSLIAIFFVGMQQMQAQDSNLPEAERPEAIAKKQTYELHQLVELTGEQQSATFKVLVDLNQNLSGLKENKDIATTQNAKIYLLEKVKVQLKSILNEKQYQVYLNSLEKSKK